MNVNDENFETEVIESTQPVMVDFFAEWCGPCKMAAPVIEELAKEYQGKVKVVKLNVDEGRETSAKYGVMSIPTVIVFKDGQEADRLVGFPGKEGYEELIKKFL
ncbi:thioredoxin [Patescibacteria group bacterium]|nr:thioredoxin [Patescibacteria group bacterium]